ncbi:conserved hypothetical protein [Theileria orientalis strain Shintoku]|uniref:Uncharacterized protein n=1 Tax=Theileria orientalis strain Shintoku TaxID=869250 RepID=J4C8C3_THEOR|nr:conserved hypothetical protein [Theileria orientalis strain Shintoku]BAM40538.1 conserved hypothetical protein [Theileria orientalis strain Shintoku]|eukprot:XP_009690839.1 conserved hypothetical protein [Theileria orientalis strain Shintoku]
MICDNCGEVFEDVENEITCPVCGVLQNITQTQTDFFSGYYAQSKRAGRLTQQAEDLELIGEIKDDKRIKRLTDKLDDKLIEQKLESLKQKELCIIVGLQEILMNLCKILVIKYEIVHLIESHSKYLWKRYLIHYFSNMNERGADSESERGKMSRSLQEDYCTNVFTNSIHPKSVNSLRTALNYYLNNVLASRNNSDNEDKRCSKGDYELNVTVLCRRIIHFTRLPNIVIIVVDKLVKYLECQSGNDCGGSSTNGTGNIKVNGSVKGTGSRKGGERGRSEDRELDGQIYGTLLGYPKNVIGCAIVLITCRLLWPIFHTQPPEFASIRKRRASANSTADSFNNTDVTDTANTINVSNTTNSANTSNASNSANNTNNANITNTSNASNMANNANTTNKSNGGSGSTKKSNGNKKSKKRIVKVVETNPKRIYHDRKENRWRIRTDEEMDSISGQSSGNRNSSTGDEEEMKKMKLEDIGNINRYGYVKAYLNVLYYYYRSRKGKVEEKKLRDELKRELLSESDLDRFKKYIVESYKKSNFSSFLSSIIYRYTTNHFLLFKLLPIFNKKTSSNNMYKHLMDYYGGSSGLSTSTCNTNNSPSRTGGDTDLLNLIRDNMVGNCEIFYLITSLFNNYPNYSGFSPEKSLEFNHFLLSTRDQKRQIMNMAREINEPKSKRTRSSVSVNDSATSGTGDRDGGDSCESETCNLYEHELERMENSFQELGKVTEVGFTLPPKPFNLKNKSYRVARALPVATQVNSQLRWSCTLPSPPMRGGSRKLSNKSNKMSSAFSYVCVFDVQWPCV